MADVVDEFVYENGIWKTSRRTATGHEFRLMVVGDASFLRSDLVAVRLQSLLSSLDSHIENATSFASESEYREDILSAGAMVLDSIVANTWDEVRVWFVLRKSGQMIGVTIRQDKPVDVYCEH